MRGSATKAPAHATVGGYQLLDKLGQGEKAVYRALDPFTSKVVAIKLLPGGVANDAVKRLRFAQECQITKQLNHPNIVRVLDFGLDGDKAYMVMEFVDGESLGDRLERDGALAESDALRLTGQLGAALQAAHARRLIHRDVKPDNVLVTAAGDVKLADLGLCKDLEGDFNLTRTKSSLGTPNFMAPEQFEDAKRADARSDQYALAATLYNMVTGALPFRARSAAAIAAIYKKQLANDIVPPRQLAPALSAHVETAILRAMRAQPNERFATIEEFLDALQAPAGEPSVGEPFVPVVPDESVMVSETTAEQVSADRRASHRYSCGQSTSCQAMQRTLDDAWPGKVIDISETGLCLELQRRFEPGAILRVVLDAAGTPRRSVLVCVIWVEKADEQSWKMGCQYDQPLGEVELAEMRS